MDRRAAIKTSAWLVGGSLSLPAVSSFLTGCQTQEEAYLPQFFTEDQFKTLSAICDRIIPPTATPGAVDVGVPQLIDVLMKEVYEPEEKTFYQTELTVFMQSCMDTQGKAFEKLSEEEKDSLLVRVEKEAYEQVKNLEEGELAPLYIRIKQLTLMGFFTSERGAKEALAFVPIPGRYEACIPLEGKAWAL